MTKTYIENENVPQIPEEYSEENLRKKFEARENELLKEIESNLESYNQLKQDERAKEATGAEGYLSSEDLSKQLQLIRSQTKDCRTESENVQYEKKLLQRYGQAFANLYYIKDEHDKKGYDEKLGFTEVDITGNGDVITDNQHYGMSFNPDGKLTQPALTVKVDDDLQFNVGMMEFNKPNSLPEVKLQISLDEETVENLDAEKLNSIFDFCEKHGISASDMIVRRFDGSLDDSAIQEKLQRLVAEVEAKRAEQEAKAAREEFEHQKSNENEIIKDIEKAVAEHGGKLPKGLTLEEAVNEANKILPKDKQIDIEKISADIPQENEMIPVFDKDGKTPKVSFKDEHLKNKSADVKDEIQEQAAPEEKSENQATTPETTQETPATQQEATTPVNSVTVPQQTTPAPAPIISKETPKEKAEKQFEKFFEEGLARKRNYSYFKTHTGLFGKGWTEYIIYDTEDRNNYRKDGIEDKNGGVKFNYNFKFFIRQDANGNMQFAYRTPNHKPLNEDIVGGIVGQLKDLGYTHVNFPNGVPDKEKGIWRKALAEKGIVPKGMSLDRSKAEGMLKAAKEKLSGEEYSKFKYRLALQMDKYNKAKGKKIDKSEQDFIDGLLLARKYEAFSNGYTEVLKGKITRLVHPPKERENGAVDKIAAMANLRRLFNVFKEGVDTGSILNSEVLTPKEKDILRNHPELLGNPSKFTGSDLAELYDIMFKQSRITAHDKLEQKFREPGAKRADEPIKTAEFNAAYNSCKSIIKELKALGVDEIDLPESTTELPYNAPLVRGNAKPAPTQTKPNTNNNNSGVVAAAHSLERSER